MRESTTDLLRCPAKIGTVVCRGPLVMSEDGLPARLAPDIDGELLEGLIRCNACGIDYPVISGVLLLVNRVGEYLTRFWRAILSAAALHGTVSDDLARWLERHHLDAPGLPSSDQRIDVNLPGSMDRLSDLVGGTRGMARSPSF